MYYREAMGAFVVYDVESQGTLDFVPNWKESLDKYLSYDDFKLPVILLGNKCDLPHDVKREAMERYAEEHGFLAWMETSAKNNVNINEAVEMLVDQIMKTESLEAALPHSDIIDPTQPEEPVENKSGKCPCA